jgi:hypothetical protein
VTFALDGFLAVRNARNARTVRRRTHRDVCGDEACTLQSARA